MGKITISANISAPLEKVWDYWTSPKHIIKWNNASDDWNTPHAQNDLRAGGKFLAKMESKDGSMGFDFEGVYTRVRNHQLIEYMLVDGRRVSVSSNPYFLCSI
ncbi:MAG: SRPBCC domain-containing protein [Bacteroidetes bacterium]|nr:SRPBCC domain-containing protein [Bacteroidota bacterium]